MPVEPMLSFVPIESVDAPTDGKVIALEPAQECFEEVVERTRRALERPGAKLKAKKIDPHASLLSLMLAQSRGEAVDEPKPQVFRDGERRLLRVVHREIVVRFRAGTSRDTRDAILDKFGFAVRAENAFVAEQCIIIDVARRQHGADLLEVANHLAKLDEVVFATPNFVSEYKKNAAKPNTPRPEQWHLTLVRAPQAWSSGRGKGIVVAVIDDGVDVKHPSLKGRIAPGGRDFFLKDTDAGFKDPNPKVFTAPFDDTDVNDIHGTCCAGVVAASGLDRVFGAAPLAKILPIKIFHGAQLAQDARVADAIRYAALHADVISCSWDAANSADVRNALEDAGSGRSGKGVPIFCAAGNEYKPNVSNVGFPAKSEHAIAVGASTQVEQHAPYSNAGPELSIVAPSSDDNASNIFTTDVSTKGMGYNPGDVAKGGANGRYANDFGGTSSATPLAAAIGALVLAANPTLTRAELKDLLQATAVKIAGQTGHTNLLGNGRVDALAAVSRAAALAPKKPPRKKNNKTKSARKKKKAKKKSAKVAPRKRAKPRRS